jgi:hypothetical protein
MLIFRAFQASATPAQTNNPPQNNCDFLFSAAIPRNASYKQMQGRKAGGGRKKSKNFQNPLPPLRKPRINW